MLQCDQIGRFLKLLTANFLAQTAKTFGNFLTTNRLCVILAKLFAEKVHWTSLIIDNGELNMILRRQNKKVVKETFQVSECSA